MSLMEEAARAADADAGGRALAQVDAVQVVGFISWSYSDPAATLAERLRIDPPEKVSTTAGGSTPQWLVNQAAERIARGELRGVLVVGAEALDSARRAEKEGIELDRRGAASQGTVIGDTRTPLHDAEINGRVVAPAQIYPMFEQTLAAKAGRTPDEQRAWLGSLMAPFTEVAATHPDHAWFPAARTPAELSEVTSDNRMIAEPYPKHLNSILQVDMGAAILLLSAEAAEEAGVPKDRRVFCWAGASAEDVYLVAQRPDLDRSVGLAVTAEALLSAAGTDIDAVGHLDLYSCFPCAVQMAAEAFGIGLDDPRGLTVTGGLPYFGGPGNNYVTHSIGMLCERLRADPGALGLVTGLSWYMTKHSAGLYSMQPPPNGWRLADTSAAQARIDATALEVAEGAEGTATVDMFTVEHDRDRGPVRAPVYATLADGRRIMAQAADASMAADISGTSIIGARIRVRSGEGGAVYELA